MMSACCLHNRGRDHRAQAAHARCAVGQTKIGGVYRGEARSWRRFIPCYAARPTFFLNINRDALPSLSARRAGPVAGLSRSPSSGSSVIHAVTTSNEPAFREPHGDHVSLQEQQGATHEEKIDASLLSLTTSSPTSER